MWVHGPFWGGFSRFLIVPVILFIAFVLMVALRIGRRGIHGGCGGMHGRSMRRPYTRSARELLDQRYARGEIDDAQYLKMKEALK